MKALYTLFFCITTGVLAMAGGGSTIGPANPAAVNCLKLQGTLESYVTSDGENANCVIEAWHLYNEMYQRGLVKEHHYPTPPIGFPNPAAVNCLDIGGSNHIRTTSTGDEMGYCVVEQWTLFRAIDITNE